MTNSTFPSLKDLSRPDSIMDTFNKVNGPGLALFSGLTAAGVSTTLAAIGGEFDRAGAKVLSLRLGDGEVLPGIPEIHSLTEKYFIRAVLGVYQPDVIIVDSSSYTPEMMRIAVGLSQADGLVLAGIHAASPEGAVERVMHARDDVTSHEIANSLIMSVHHQMVPAGENEFDEAHWKAVGKAENLTSMANPARPPFAYREDRKVETTMGIYVPTEPWVAPHMNSYLSSKKWKTDAEFLEVLAQHRVTA